MQSKEQQYEDAFRERTLAYAAIERASKELHEANKRLERLGESQLQLQLRAAAVHVSDLRHDLGVSIGELV